MNTLTASENKASPVVAGKSTFALVLITTLFLLWGFANNLDPILIPHLKKSFALSTLEATLVDSAVFAAYFLFAVPAGTPFVRQASPKFRLLIIWAYAALRFLPAALPERH